MIERQITLPASPEQVWEALVDAEILADWFGGKVDWEMKPGSDFTVTEEDGSTRHGIVKTVTEGDALQFEWWPEDDVTEASEVTYTLEPTEGDETVLTVTERQLDAQMSADTWTATDDLLFRVWVRSLPSVVA
jgi:uncharacterized protein YndB with AHSA1/START domain